jgi:hypothetical protein
MHEKKSEHEASIFLLIFDGKKMKNHACSLLVVP